jgi:protease I
MVRSIRWFYILFAVVVGVSSSCSRLDSETLADALQSKASAQRKRPGRTTTVKPVAGKKVLMVIAPKNFRDEELFKTREVIEAAGHRVVLASTSTEQSTGMLGGKAKPDIVIDKVDASQYDAVVFVGGSGAAVLLKDPAALSLARSAHTAGKLVAAICMAPGILANADLLKGKKATSWKGGHDLLKAKGAKVTDKQVEQDGRIITGNGPAAAKAFGEAIVRYLAKP